MAHYLFTVTFDAATNMPADSIVNTWHFDGSGSDYENVADMLTDFYDAVPTGETTSISEFMTQQSINGDYTIRAYDMSDAEPRTPQYEVTRTLVELSNAVSLPTEVSICFSYHAQLVSGVAAARRRGRVFLGGFATSAMEQALGAARPKVITMDTIIAAGRDLIQASNASTSWEWQQWSKTADVGNIVVGGWVDNAFDTQRRRGVDATYRLTFTGGTP